MTPLTSVNNPTNQAIDEPAFEFQPVLAGSTLLLRPLSADDFEALYQAASDPLIWEQHPSPLRYQREPFGQEFFAGALASGSAFVITEKITNKVIGSSRYYEWDPAKREVAIGFTFLTREHWGGITNRELKQLMLAHAFRYVDRVWFHIGRSNWRSRKGTEKIGARFSHDGVKTLNGVNHEYAFYVVDSPSAAQ